MAREYGGLKHLETEDKLVISLTIGSGGIDLKGYSDMLEASGTSRSPTDGTLTVSKDDNYTIDYVIDLETPAVAELTGDEATDPAVILELRGTSYGLIESSRVSLLKTPGYHRFVISVPNKALKAAEKISLRFAWENIKTEQDISIVTADFRETSLA